MIKIMKNYSDRKLIADYLKGDEKSLEILIQQYLKPIYNFVYRYAGNAQDAEDITQDVFVKVWRNLKKFDRQKASGLGFSLLPKIPLLMR